MDCKANDLYRALEIPGPHCHTDCGIYAMRRSGAQQKRVIV